MSRFTTAQLLRSAVILPVLLYALTAGADEEVVFQWRKTVDFDGRVREETPVRTLVDRLDAPNYWVDLDRLEDSEGRSFRMVADAWQDEGEKLVHYEIRLAQYAPEIETHEQLSQRWAVSRGAGEPDFGSFVAKKRATAQTPAPRLVDGLERWLDEAHPDELVDVVVKLDSEMPLNLPRLSAAMFSTEPALALAQMEDRILAIEQQKTAIEGAQRPIIEQLRRGGATILRQYWLLNGFEARVSASDLEQLAKDPSIRRVEKKLEPTPDTNNLDDMREAAQIVPLHAAGFRGESPSGAATINDIHLAIIDTTIDVDHPAWDDWANGPSRLVDVWRDTGGGVWSTVSTSATTLPSHGTKVAALAMADLMQYQDPAIVVVADQDDRTGFAPEASFSFIEASAGITASVEKAVSESVDIINMSITDQYTCDLAHITNAAVDAAMLSGIFVAKSAGSNGAPGPACNIGNPGTASGAFTVTSYDRTAVPLVTGLVLGGSSHGPDANGRAVVALAAPGGTEGMTTAAFDDTYGGFGATSSATATISGSAAVVKEHLIDVFGASLINEVGFLYASMLMMTDGETETGWVGANAPLDGDWGAGRFRARMLNNEGMDGPWRMRLISTVVEDGETVTDLHVNPDTFGTNQPLSADVDRVRAAVYWHEPNLEYTAADTASIRASICRNIGCYSSGNDNEERQRLLLNNLVAGGDTWWIQLIGLDVPASNEPDYYFGEDKRKVYIAVYFEDEDRDDADGPDASIQ